MSLGSVNLGRCVKTWPVKEVKKTLDFRTNGPTLLLAPLTKGWILHYPLKQTPGGFSRLA